MKAKQQAASSSAPRIVYFSLSDLSILSWLTLLYAQFIYLSTVSPHNRSALHPLYPSLPVCSAASLAAQSLLLNILVLLYVLLPPCVWVSLSSNTCCRRSASLLSDDAQSSPPSVLAFRPTLPVFLSSPSSHTCMHLTGFFCFNSQINTNGAFSPSPALPADVSPLFVFHLHLPPFLWICLWAAHPSCECCFA